MPGPSFALPETGILDGPLGISTDGILFASTAAAIITGIGPSRVPDNGGVKVTALGVFPTDERIKVQVIVPGEPNSLCYSGVVGQEEWCTSGDGLSLSFVVRPLPIGGPYNLLFTTEDSVANTIFPSALTVIHRSFVTNLYGLRGSIAHPRFVGPRTIRDEP